MLPDFLRGGIARLHEILRKRGESRWFRRLAAMIVGLLAFLVPLFALPFTQDPLFAKAVLVEIAAVVLGALWLFDAFSQKRLFLAQNPWNIGFLALAAALIAATVFSRSPWTTFWGGDVTGEKTASILAFMIIAWVVAAFFRRRDVIRTSVLLLASFGLLGLYTIVSLLAARFGSVPVWLGLNPVGTVNALAYVFAIGFLIAFGFALSRATSTGRSLLPIWLGRLAVVVGVLLFFALVLLGFRILWIALGFVVALILVIDFVKTWERDGAREYAFGSTVLAVGVAVLAAMVFFAVKPLPFGDPAGQFFIYQPPIEISPSLSANLAIDRAVLREHPLFGVGPGNFASAFNRFRDADFYNKQFPELWAVRFHHGLSLLATIPATVGVVGLLAFLAFIALLLVAIGRAFLKAPESNPFVWAYGTSACFVALMWFIYGGNFTGAFLLFFCLGVLGATLPETPIAAGEAGADPGWRGAWWRVGRRVIAVDTPPLHFAVALAVAFGGAVSLVAIWGMVTQYAAEVYFFHAVRAANVSGNMDSAKVFLDRAASLNPTDSSYYQGRAQVGIVAVLRLVQRAAQSSGEDFKNRFGSEFGQALAAGQRATVLAPDNPHNWFVLGELQENVIPFVDGAADAAAGAYAEAHALDPANPVYPFAIGRARLTEADFLNFEISGTASGDARSKLEAERKAIVRTAEEALAAAADLKPDYAQAHFLLAQIAIRENNLAEAIKRTVDTLRLAPNDVGVAFQLGVLSYTAGDFDGAKDAFNRAIALNDNYSNARYFLGLIWDRQGDRDAALSQFQKIFALNPDNEEVKKIIANLEKGKRALDGIVPPAPAPERRREAPVKESGEGSPPLRHVPAER